MLNTTRPTRAVFTLRIAGKPGTTGIHALRFLLKRLLRQYGFVALDVYEESAPARDASNEIADAFAGLRRDVRHRVRTAPPKIHELRTVAGAGRGRNASAEKEN
jgi:hypothetical protein